MTRLRIADLKHRVRLEAPVRSGDGGGGGSLAWVQVAEFWAAVTPVSGGEQLFSESLRAKVTHTIYCRYRTDVRVTQRIVLGPRIFEIRSVENKDDDKVFLKLRCEELLT